MTYTATFDDWLAVLGVRDEFLETFEGQRAIGAAVSGLIAARGQWPGVNQDYIDILDQATAALVELRDTVVEQHEWLERLREQVMVMNGVQEYVFVHDPPPDPVDRLLNEDELDEIQGVLDEIDEAVGAIENAPDDEDGEWDDAWGDEE